MRASQSTSSRPDFLWTVALAIALPLAASLLLGQDINWDLQNYHLYNPFAWLHGRLTTDIAPAQLQSWHNPMLDVPLYLMVAAHWPGLIVAMWLTLPSIAAMLALLRIQALLVARPLARWEPAALAVLATGGVAFFAGVGTCFNDTFVAAGMLWSLFIVLRDPAADRRWSWAFAGALAGAVAGLKLTATLYCLGLAGAAFLGPAQDRLPGRMLALLLGGIAGVSLTFGYWGFLLAHLHGNPVFPYFNQYFQSPDATWTAHADLRFVPKGLIDAVLVPFRLLFSSHRFSEPDLRDPRLLVGVLGFAWLSWTALRHGALGDTARNARLRILGGFYFVSLAAWTLQYGVYRYVVPLEMLACLGLLLALEGLPAARRAAGTIIACLLVVALSFPASWGRRHFAAEFVTADMPALPANSMVVISSQSPLAYAVTALPDSVPAIAIYNNLMVPGECTGLMAQAQERIAGHAGPLWLLRGNDAPDDEGETIARDRFALRAVAPCLPVRTTFGSLWLCPLRRDPKPPLCALAAPAPGR